MTLEATTVRNLVREPSPSVVSRLDTLDDNALLGRVRTAAHIKRFLERFCADAHFRELLTLDVAATLSQYELSIATSDAEAFLAATSDETGANSEFASVNLRDFQDFAIQCLGGIEILRAAAGSTNRLFHQWRERQLARLRFEFSALGDNIVRPVVAFELSSGCTVGCWFCAISAEKFSGNYAYGEGLEWRNTIGVFHDLLGPAAGAAFCYWATDPLDNPDYERFALDLNATTGVFPPTTTALPLKSAARTRALLALSQRNGCRLNRLSILTLPMLDRLHRQFSAEELAFVELVLQNAGALVFAPFPKTWPAAKILAGKIRSGSGGDIRQRSAAAAGTIACVTGFLINMVERTIRLVSPCMANDEWPLGYRVHERATFASVEELRSRLEHMIDKHMPAAPPESSPIRFVEGTQYSALQDGFRLSSPNHTIDFREPWTRFHLNYPLLGELIRRADSTAGELVARMLNNGSASEHVHEGIHRLWQAGALCDPPFREAQLIAFPAQTAGTATHA